jgi:CheY-like chemotaxis protein
VSGLPGEAGNDPALWARLVTAMPLGAAAWRVDPDGTLILAAANAAASRLSGLDLASLLGQPFAAIFATGSLAEVLVEAARTQAATHLSPLTGADGRVYAAEVVPLGADAVGATFPEVTLYGSVPPSSTRSPGSTRSPASARGATRPGHILVIDDEPMVGRLVERALGRGHQVTSVVTGRDGLERLASGERFDLILCDLMMPELTGMDLYERVVALCSDQAERMVFLTGGAFTRRARDFLENRPFLEKPFDLSALEALVRDRLG